MKKLKSTLFFIAVLAFYFAGTTFGYSQSKDEIAKHPLAVVNGYFVRYGDLAKLKDNLIESRVELDSSEASRVFGDRGENGAVVIILKNKQMSAGGSKVNEADLQKLEELAEAKKKKKEECEKELSDYNEAMQQIVETKKVEKVEQISSPKPVNQQELRKNDEESFKENFPEEVRNMLQSEYNKSVNDSAIKKIVVDGREVSKEEALKISVFDVNTSTSVYNKDRTEGTLEIKLIQR